MFARAEQTKCYAYQLINEQRSDVNAYNTSYSYDPVGNRTQNDSSALTTSIYNQANELTSLQPPTGQPTTSLWDANGNLSIENTGGQLTSYAWDPENRYRSRLPSRCTRHHDLLQ